MRLRTAGLVAVGLLVAPAAARAHLVTTGLGPVYDGITHLVVSPSDLLLVAALALLAGLGGAAHGRLMLAVLPVSWLAGGLLGLQGSSEIYLPVAMALALLAAGVLVALDLSIPRVVIGGLAAVLGVCWGVLKGTALGEAGAGVLGLIGIVVTVLVVATLVAGLVVGSRAAWARIVFRVAGSWIAAVAILMLGWAIKGATG